MSRPKCTATTKAGAPCMWAAAFDGLCLSHAAVAGHPEAKALHTARAARGGAKALLRPRMPTTPLRRVEDIQALVEGIIAELRNSRGEVVPRSNALEKLARLSLELLRVGQLEEENAELRRALAERAPELAARLKAVR